MTKVFAIDDETSILEYLKTVAESLGCQFISSRHAHNALQEIEKVRPDILFIDVLLPETDGLTFCQRLRSNPKLKNLPVVLMSSLSDSGVISEAASLGLDYVSKPFEKDVVKNKIEKVLLAPIA